jgi:glutamate/tyrosine decarboxylase-like PLP-dependent enzyme
VAVHATTWKAEKGKETMKGIKTEKINPEEETLDPQDWESMRDLGHRMVDEIVRNLSTIRERPPWQHAPEQVRAHFEGPMPVDPQPPTEIYDEFLEYIQPYPVGNIHPRFWGWVFGTGTFLGAMAEMLAAGMNLGAAGGLSYHSANYVENQVLDWLKEMLGFPISSSGLLTSGCSAANLIGLAVARNTRAGYDLRRQGLRTASASMVLYTSEQAHSSIQKAVELLGLGSDALRLVPVDDQFRIDLKALAASITSDRKSGLYPFCVVGAAGTTNSGAVDDLEALADLCQMEDLWFHVDGAFGAWAAIAPRSKVLVKGLERADSLAFDLHKWMYMPYTIGCVLVRREEDHRHAFSLTPDYLAHGEGSRRLTGQDFPWLSDYGYELSRGFHALKAWMSLKEHGLDKYSRLIQQNIDQTHYLAELIESSPKLELTAPASLNVVCFRYVDPGLTDEVLDGLNKEIEIELQEQGIAVLSGTKLRGNYVLHVAHCNHRTQREDMDLLVREVIRIGNRLAKSTVNGFQT